MDFVPDESAVNTELIEVRFVAGCFRSSLSPLTLPHRPAGCTLVSTLSAAHNERIAAQIDNETLDMLKTLNMANLPGIKVQQVFIQPLHSLALPSRSDDVCCRSASGRAVR